MSPHVQSQDVLLYILALIFPPLPVFIRKGLFTREMAISLFLTAFFHFPGLLYSWYVTYESSLDRQTDSRGYRDIEQQTNETGIPQFEAYSDNNVTPPAYEDIAEGSTSGEPVAPLGDNKIQK